VVTDIVSTWRPALWSPTLNPGVASAGFPARATWALIEEVLVGRESMRWGDVRSVRLDGPRATDAALAKLIEAGCLDRVEVLHLAGEGFTASGVAAALALPALTTLRLEKVSAQVDVGVESRVRTVELRSCSPESCAAVVRATTSLTAIHLDSIEIGAAGDVWDALGERALTSVQLAHVACASDAFGRVVAGSGRSLETLVLDDIAGLDGDVLAGDWPALRSLAWQRAKLSALPMPVTLTSLSLRATSIGRFSAASLPPGLTRIDCIGSTASDAVAARVGELQGLEELGLAASPAAAQAVAVLAEAGGLRTLELGAGAGASIAAVPGTLASLTVDKAWTVDEGLMLAVLGGEGTMRELVLHGVGIGNPDLGGRLSPALERLELVECGGFVEGLGHGDESLALRRLVLDDIEIRGAELAALLSRCEHLASLSLAGVVGVGPDDLAAILGPIGARVVQLELVRFPDEAAAEYGEAIRSSRYPLLAELHLDRRVASPAAIAHVADADVTPALERLHLDGATADEQWRQLAARPVSALHWIRGYHAGGRDELVAQLRAADSGLSGAECHLRQSR
jgi:hypothetical protein